jgi:predicted permease
MTREGATDLTARVRLPQVARDLETLGVTEDYFAVLGLHVRGREITSEDLTPGAPLAGVLSDRVWREAFNADANVIGATIAASPLPIRIVGVAPPGFTGALRGERVELWLPYTQLPEVAGGKARGRLDLIPLISLCRLRSGATLATSRAAFLAAYASYRAPDDDLALVPLQNLFGAIDLPMVVIRHGQIVMIVGGVALLLLIAGGTTLVALLLVHYEHRRREIATRIALGAEPLDLVRQVMVELGTVALAAVLGVVAIAAAAATVLPHFALRGGVDFSRLDFSPDWRVVFVAVAACLIVLAGSAVLPLLRVLRANLTASLAQNPATRTHQALRFHRVILGVHAALTVLCVVVAGLFVRSALNALTRGPGFDDARTLFVTVRTQSFRGWEENAIEAELGRQAAVAQDLMQTIRSRPGVEAVALGEPPLGHRLALRLAAPSVVETDGAAQDLHGTMHPVGPGYLEALGVPLLAGRTATADEIIVTASLAAQLWPDASPLGRSLRWGPVRGRVVGVVDMGFASIRFGRPKMFLTFTLAQNLAAALRSQHLQLVVRAQQPDTVREDLRRLTETAFPHAPFIRIVSGRELVQTDLGQERLAASFLSTIGAATWLLGVASIFGLVTYVVERRRREFGIRAALGASRSHLIWFAAREGVEPALIGGAAGIVAAIALARTVEAYLLGIAAVDVLTYAGALGLFAGCAVMASVVAAIRIRQIRPAEALRTES